MDKEAAKKLLNETFDAPFDEGRFNLFALNLLNDVDTTKGFPFLSGNYIRHSFKNHITQYRRLGSYTDPQGESIDVLVVKLTNDWALERSRTMLRNFTADYLENRGRKDSALVAYYTDNPEDWRFSYIRMDYKQELTDSGKIRVKKELTPARRYSFLVGVNEPNHTAQAQLLDILKDDRSNPTLSALEVAFSVDAVTKQFYLDYRDLFIRLHEELDSIVSLDSKVAKEFETKTIDTANFAKKLMGQIVFLYFLQKKGWLGVGKDENGNFKKWGTGPKNFLQRLFKKEFSQYNNFYCDVLEPLFYEALASEHDDDYYSPLDCKIPFLNGGLFEPLHEYNWRETNIQIDNDILADVFTTFNQYNFTVREDEPLEKEVAIDPEMLGKVFENLLPENLRKGKGAYYTPRTIVHYMCQESLINYLDTECGPIPKKDIETLIREGDLILELETAIHEEGKKYQSVLMDSIKDNAQAIDDALASIKVCDPAIGSGAFPVGMLNEIVKTRKVLELYLQKEETTYTLKRHCIQESIYGVDIEPGAIDIAKLRLWLSLVVDENDYSHIQALPNLDYKIMQGNSLIEEFHGISLDIEQKPDKQIDVFSGGSSLDDLIEDLHKKQADFFNAEHPQDKKKKRENVETAIYNIFHYELEKKRDISPQETQEIEVDLREMTHGNKVRNFFPWKLYFADVFREKGGFDVVIANPPYIRSEKINKDDLIKYFQSFETALQKCDIYGFFIEKSINTLCKSGLLCLITSESWLSQYSFYKLRDYLLDNTSIKKLIVFDSQVFDTAAVETSILFTKNIENIYCKFNIYEMQNNYREMKLIGLLPYKTVRSFPGNIIITKPINSIIEKKFVTKTEKLDDLYNISFGVMTGDDSKFTYHELKNSKFDKKVLRGGNIKRYSINWTGEYIYYNPNEMIAHKSTARPGNPRRFEQEKIIIKREGAGNVIAALDNDNFYTIGSTFIVSNKTNCSLRYLLCLLNSLLINYWYGMRFKTITQSINSYKSLPIKVTDNQQPFINLVDQILTAKNAKPQADTTSLEANIDQLVYELYGLTEEEIAIVEESVG